MSRLTPSSSAQALAKPRSSGQGVSRRAPRQERSQQTVDAILAATRQLVAERGVESVTTNAVARRAGVSIGSLYQYFPGKRALIAELRRLHQETGQVIFRAEAVSLFHAPVGDAVRRFVEKMIEVHRAEPRLHRALELEGRGKLGDWERDALGIIRAYLEHHKHELCVTNLDHAAFVVAATVEAITHGAVLERPDLLGDESLVDGISRMLRCYLVGS
jgi:AcrR family transcriptional regulator